MLLLNITAAAQDIYFKPMASVLKLPSDECYNILRDRKGYIWVATENGLCRYNGHGVTLFDAQKGLPEKTVYFMKEDQAGRLWLVTSSSRILQITGDTIREAPFSAAYAALRKQTNNQEVTVLLHHKKNGQVLLSGYTQSYEVSRDNAVTLAKTDSSGPEPANCMLYMNEAESYIIRNKKLRSHDFYWKKMDYSIDVITPTTRKKIRLSFKKGNYPGLRLKLSETRDYLFLGIGCKLVKINKRKLEVSSEDLPNFIFCLMHDSDGGLWVGMKNSGLRYYADIEKMEAGFALDGCSVSGICQDREGGLWCSTIEKSVFYCGNKAIRYFPKIKELCGRSTFLKAVGDTVFTSTKPDELLLINKDSCVKLKLLQNRLGDVMDILRLGKSWYVATKGYLVVLSPKLTLQQSIKQYAFRMDTFSGRVHGLLYNSVFSISKHDQMFFSNIHHRGTDILCYARDSMYIGTQDGVFKCHNTSGRMQKLNGINTTVTQMLHTRGGQVLVATKGEGLWWLEKNTLKRISADLPHFINDMQEDKDGYFWLATNEGLVKLKLTGDNCQQQQFRVSSGLPSDNLNALTVTPSQVYFSTVEGLFRMPLNANLQNKVPPGFYLCRVQINGKDFPLQQVYQLPYSQNSLAVSFDLLAFKKNDEGNALVYRMEGLDTSFRIIHDRKLTFVGLAPGEYKLHVYTRNNDGVKSKPLIISFFIQKPFWKTWWFIAFCTGITLLMLTLLVTLIVKNIRRKAAQKAQIDKLLAESQLSALQAQMNPHFIFNAISSIQSYILKKQEEQAYNYLAKFGSLIRMVLNHSRLQHVTLLQEVDLLRLYVEIEQLRFRSRFSFNLILDEAVDLQEVEIPTMLIQPYIENAIWHGLLHLDADKPAELLLSISKQQDHLKIIVQDNGIGRTKAAEYRRRGLSQPVAMEVTGQRLEIINRLRGMQGLRAIVSDLYDTSGVACGTRVELFLAFEQEEEA